MMVLSSVQNDANTQNNTMTVSNALNKYIKTEEPVA